MGREGFTFPAAIKKGATLIYFFFFFLVVFFHGFKERGYFTSMRLKKAMIKKVQKKRLCMCEKSVGEVDRGILMSMTLSWQRGRRDKISP